MILAVFFNPYLHARVFNRDALTANNLFHLVRHAFNRLLDQDANGDIEFGDTFRAYYDSTGKFSHEAMWLDGHANSYNAAVRLVYYYLNQTEC